MTPLPSVATPLAALAVVIAFTSRAVHSQAPEATPQPASATSVAEVTGSLQGRGCTSVLALGRQVLEMIRRDGSVTAQVIDREPLDPAQRSDFTMKMRSMPLTLERPHDLLHETVVRVLHWVGFENESLSEDGV